MICTSAFAFYSHQQLTKESKVSFCSHRPPKRRSNYKAVSTEKTARVSRIIFEDYCNADADLSIVYKKRTAFHNSETSVNGAKRQPWKVQLSHVRICRAQNCAADEWIWNELCSAYQPRRTQKSENNGIGK